MSLQELAQSRQKRLQSLKQKVLDVPIDNNNTDTKTTNNNTDTSHNNDKIHNNIETSHNNTITATEIATDNDLLQAQLDILKKRTDESIKRIVRRRVMEGVEE